MQDFFFRPAESSAADEERVNLLHIFPNYSRSLRAKCSTIQIRRRNARHDRHILAGPRSLYDGKTPIWRRNISLIELLYVCFLSEYLLG
jgi:hypothetical protein